MGEFIKIRNLSGGLFLGAPEDEVPEGSLIRARGLHPISSRSARSRFGGTLIHSLNAHSIFRYKDAWYYGVSTSFYAGSVSVKSSLGGSRLAAIKTGPTAGVDDRLFIAGGDELFKIDVSTSIVNSGYKWTASGSGTNEYYLTDSGGSDPGLSEPDTLLVDGEAATAGTVGSLAAGEWVYDDNDALGYDTIYIRLSDGTDPDTKADDYILALYVYDWGITPPEDTLNTADGGAGGNLDDGAVYGYLITFYNSKTGTRSNPTTPTLPSAEDPYTKLLLHCEGVDAAQVFTDDSPSGHTVTAQNNANTDDAQAKFGSTSCELEAGTSDYLSVPDSSDWFFGASPFTIDCWVRFESLPTDGNLMTFYTQYVDANNYVYFAIWNVSGTYYLVFAVYSGGVNTIFGYGAWVGVSTGTWYHIAAIRGWGGAANGFALCVDGTSITSWSDSSTIPDFAASIYIGRWGTATYYFDGWIDEFRISKGIARWTSNFTPPSDPYSDAGGGGAYIDLAGGSTSIDLTQIPESNDPQVDFVELWRTSGGGSTYYLLTRLVNGTTSYTDDISDDDLESVECPTDNLKPYSWFDDCYVANASVFWITRTEVGERGRLYYSSIGRAENIEGYINVTSDADPCQKIFGWRGYTGVITQSGLYQILGTNPYQAKPVSGVPGTNNPHTVIVTPIGLVYEANDGIRVFDGSTSRLLNFDAVSKIYRGTSAGDLTSFDGVVAGYARGEYFVSDGSQTLAVHLKSFRWRDLGIGCNALKYAEGDDILAASISNTVLDFEDEGTTQDNATNITFTIEPKHIRLSEDKKVIVQNIHVDADVNSETLAVSLVHDSSTTALGNLTQGANRQVTTLPAGTLARVASVKITGTIDNIVEIFGIDIEI